MYMLVRALNICSVLYVSLGSKVSPSIFRFRVTGLCAWVVLLLLFTHSLVCGGGESDHPTFGPPARLSLHLASSSITPAASVHKSRGNNVVSMWGAVEEMMCVECVDVTEGA